MKDDRGLYWTAVIAVYSFWAALIWAAWQVLMKLISILL